MKKIPVGVLGATGMVGQRFLTMLDGHPWFEMVCLGASPNSSGKTYHEAVGDRWRIESPMPSYVKNMNVYSVEEDFSLISSKARLVFSAMDLPKEKIKKIEESYAQSGVVIVSNNSAHRWSEDVPMIIPEINPKHLALIETQRKQRGWEKGFIVVKSNCSIQSYLPIIHALSGFGPSKIQVTTLQAISGAGKTFESWPKMIENCIPFISGEEEKTEREPLKILGSLRKEGIRLKEGLKISATCIRVPVADGHMVSASVKFNKKPTLEGIIDAIKNYKNPISALNLPSAPKEFIHYFEEDDRPQTRLDRSLGGGMTVSCGRFREDSLFDWKFVSLSHNTIRGAAGGAILTAELLMAKKMI